MKVYKLSIGLAFLVFLVFSGCSENNDDESIEISCSIKNCPVKEVKIYNASFNDSIKLNEFGKVHFRFNSKKGAYYNCSIGKQNARLYLLPGDRLNIAVDYNNFDSTLSFNGPGSRANNYLIQQFLIDRKYFKSIKEKFTLLPGKFRDITDKIYNAKNSLLDSYGFDKRRYADFLKIERAKILYAFTRDRLKYKENFQYFTKTKAPRLQNDYYSFIRMIDFNDTSLMKYAIYRETLEKYIEVQSQRELLKISEIRNDELVETKVILQLLKQTFQNRIIYNWLLKKFMEDQIAQFKMNDSLMKEIQMNYVDNDEIFQKLNLQYQKSRQLQKGKRAPNFMVYTAGGDTVKLADFKGKFVYIDVWSTYCGPCIREMPEFLALSKEYPDNQIEFLCISIDNKKEHWLNFIKKRKLQGTQLFAGGRHSDFSNDYLIEEIPRNILIDNEGKIINARADRPMDIKPELDASLSKNKLP